MPTQKLYPSTIDRRDHNNYRLPYKKYEFDGRDSLDMVNACSKAARLSKETTTPIVVLLDEKHGTLHVRETSLQTGWETPQLVWQAEFDNGFVAAFVRGKSVWAVGYPEMGYGGRLVVK